MPHYCLTAKFAASTIVKAETLEEAMKIATSRHVSLESGSLFADEAWIVDDTHGIAEDICEQ